MALYIAFIKTHFINKSCPSKSPSVEHFAKQDSKEKQIGPVKDTGLVLTKRTTDGHEIGWESFL